MPIKKRSGLSTATRFIEYVDGELSIRTPATCTKWHPDFRMRIIAHWFPPVHHKDVKRNTIPMEDYLAKMPQDVIYRVDGHRIAVKNPLAAGHDKPYAIISHTEVHNLSARRGMRLLHPHAGVRVLTVYAFLNNCEIWNLPHYDTYEI